MLAIDHGTLTMLRQLHAAWRKSQSGQVESVGYVFPGAGGGPLLPDSITQLFRHLNDASGLPPVRLHDLRHGAASLSLAVGNDLRTVQALLGHASIILTANTYISVLPNLAQHAVKTTARLVTNPGHNSPADPARRRHWPSRWAAGRPYRGIADTGCG